MSRYLPATVFVVAWSSGFVGATLADAAARPAPLLAWRYLITAGLLLAVTLSVRSTRTELRQLSGRTCTRQAVLGLLAHAIFLGGVFLAASRGLDAAVSALVCALQPLLVAAGGQVWFGDRLTVRQWGGLVTALVGVAIGVGGIGGATDGVWLVVASLVALCGAALLERAWQPAVSVPVSLTLQVSTASLVFCGYAGVTGGLVLTPTADLAVALGWLVLLSGVVGYASFTWCLRRLGATATSTLLYLTPAVTAVWAWVMFGQPVTAPQVGGFVVVLLSVALAARHRPTSQGAGGRPVR